MSLFSDLGTDVHDILSDPDLATANVKLRRVTSITAGANPEDDPVEVATLIKLSCVVFTRETRRSDFENSLVIQRVDEITSSPHAFVVEEGGVPVSPRKFYLGEVLSTDEFYVDGDLRQVTQIVRTPAAGPDVAVWQIQVLP